MAKKASKSVGSDASAGQATPASSGTRRTSAASALRAPRKAAAPARSRRPSAPSAEMSSEAPVERRTVSMPQDLIEHIEIQMGPRAFSAFVTRAARRELERVRLEALVSELREEIGEVPAEVRDQVDASLNEAFAASKE